MKIKSLSDKEALYNLLFPKMIASRMIIGCDKRNIETEMTKCEHICEFAYWDKTKEGNDFWDAISNLYYPIDQPNEQQILQVFKLYNIKP